jgi:hypothetical protein
VAARAGAGYLSLGTIGLFLQAVPAMETDPLAFDRVDTTAIANPWPVLLTGLVAMGAACAACQFAGDNQRVLWLLLPAGLGAATAAVLIAPRFPAVLGCASIACLLAHLVATRMEWDSSSPLLFGIAAALAALAAVLLLLPRAARRCAISLMIVFHFGGILTAITMGPSPSWVPSQLWVYVYRPYLQFLHLNYTYRFTEPGPAHLLWFLIDYDPGADGTRYYRWVKVPDVDENGRPVDEAPDGTRRHIPRIEFTRRLGLAIQSTWPKESLPDLRERCERHVAAGDSPDLALIREASGGRSDWPFRVKVPIEQQYLEPMLGAQIWLRSYARYVARTYPHRQEPWRAVVSVRVYLVVHDILIPFEYAEGRRPTDPLTYLTYFQGEYDPDGNPRSRILRFDERGQLVESHRDPFLHWLVHPANEKPGK